VVPDDQNLDLDAGAGWKPTDTSGPRLPGASGQQLLTAMIRVVSSVAGLTRLLTGLMPCIRSVGRLPEGTEGTHRSGGVTR
jgi:hypothetical protein